MAKACMGRQDRPGDRAPWLGLVVMAMALAWTGCATFSAQTPETGVREGFEGVRVQRVAVMPFVTADPFGMDTAERRRVLALYEAEAIATLSELGAEVMSPDRVRDALVKSGRKGELARRLQLDRPLERLFELEAIDERRQFEDERKVFARELREVLGVDALFVGEVVYHTTGRCPSGDESPYTDHVDVVGSRTAPATDVPCAVSHFQAKLIDTRTGLTLWYNRVLREVRAASDAAGSPDADANAAETVRLVVKQSNGGVARLIAEPSRSPEASISQREVD